MSHRNSRTAKVLQQSTDHRSLPFPPVWPAAVAFLAVILSLSTVPHFRVAAQSTPPESSATTAGQEASAIESGTVNSPAHVSPTTFGLVFVNSAEAPSGENRVRRGVDSGAWFDRFPLYWDRIEPQRGQFNWAPQDTALQANEIRGLKTVAILLGTPGQYYTAGVRTTGPDPDSGWRPLGGSFVREMEGSSQEDVSGQATCQPGDGPPPPQGLYEPIFADGTDIPAPEKAVNPENPWATFARSAAERYKPGGSAGLTVRHWEIWNEPDLCHFWSGTVQDYVRLLKVAYLVIKQSDPDAIVMWGGLAHFANGQFSTELVRMLAADPMAGEFDGFFDAAASHHYSLSFQGYAYTARVRNLLAGAGWSNKPIWITESGVPVCDDFPGPACPSDWRATPEEQAAYIWQNVAYTRLAGGGPIFHFMLHDDCGNVNAFDSPDGFGLVKNEAISPCSPANAEARQSYTAFQLANQFFQDTRLAWADILEGSVRRVAFYHPDTNERRLLVWNLGPNEVVGRVPATGLEAVRITLDGSRETVRPENGEYRLSLPGATNRNWPDGQGNYDIGIYGAPFLLVEQDNLPPVTSIQPLPAISYLTFQVQWQAVDWGSGLANVSVWKQEEGGPWEVWLVDVAAKGGASFTGEDGRTYRFAVLAADQAGNSLTTPIAQAETTASKEPPLANVTGRVVNAAGHPVQGARITIGEASAPTDSQGFFAVSVAMGSWDVEVEGIVSNYGRLFDRDTVLFLLYPGPGNAVTNGDFERGLDGWLESGSSPMQVQQQPGTADHALRLATGFVPNPGVPGDEGSDGGNSTVSQLVQVPAVRPYLAFAYKVETEEGPDGLDKFEVIVVEDNRPADYLHVQNTAREWSYVFLNLEKYAGKEVTLIFNVYQSSPNRPTSAVIDLVTLVSVTQGEEIFLPVVANPS